jgi:hypothetical protein
MNKSNYSIQKVKDDEVDLILQDMTQTGINVIYASLKAGQEAIMTPLSKTSKLSVLSQYFSQGQEKNLVFYDVWDDNKIIYFASSNPKLIEETTRITRINPLRILGTSLIVILESIYLGAVSFAFLVVLGPFLLLILLNKVLPEFRFKDYVQSGICAILQLLLKLRLIYYLIHKMHSYDFAPLFIGSEPTVYIVLSLMSIGAYGLMMNYIRQNKQYSASQISGYLRFIVYDFLMYTLLVTVYTSTGFVLYKL